MIYTNKHNYPETIKKAVLADSYNKGDSEYSATGLIKPARIAALERQYADVLESDVDDQLFRLYGQIGHVLLERAGTAVGKGMVEQRFFGTVGGTRISAQIDSLSLEEDGTLIDWKFTTVYGFKSGSQPKDEWTAQMNIQLELLRQNGTTANSMRIYGLLRDWRPGESKKEKGYPKKVAFHDITMWSRNFTLGYIEGRIQAHKNAEKELPECTQNENWKYRRCESYCGVSGHCSQFQDYLTAKKEIL